MYTVKRFPIHPGCVVQCTYCIYTSIYMYKKAKQMYTLYIQSRTVNYREKTLSCLGQDSNPCLQSSSLAL